ncbi:MAG: PilN domain-containing protein [Rhodanobacteraceae bacterium]
MAKINLLPWRAERRERRKREFFGQLGLAAAAAVVLVLLWSFWMGMRIQNQDDRNAYLKAQIAQLDVKITEIKNLQKVKDRLLARKRIVEKLQSSRSQMVHLFDQIVETIPSGARLIALKQQADKLTLDGVAQSNATVAEYMRNIEASPWMGPATLVKTVNAHTDSNTPYEFELVVKLDTPKDDGDAPASGASTATPSSSATTLARSPASGEVAVADAASAPTPTASAPAASAAAPRASSAAAVAKAPQAPAAPASKPGAKP